MTTTTAAPQGFGFKDFSETEAFINQSIQATASNLQGFTVRDDFDDEIDDFLRENTILWQLIKNKKEANAATVKKISKDRRPQVGFVDRSNLTGANANTMTQTQKNLSDPGQDVKALAGTIEFEHFARSLHEQQGRPYGDEVAEETEDLLINGARFLEMSLFTGDAAADPLQFNGIDKLIHPANIFTADITGSNPDLISTKLNEMCVRASSDRNIMQMPNLILGTGAASIKLQEEVGQAVYFNNKSEVVPGVHVPGILGPKGIIPVVQTPYINDLDGGAGNDVIRIYLIDINLLEWHGVYPFGGSKTLNMQIFDVTNYISNRPLVEKRMALMYGCLYARNMGRGIWRLDVTVPSGSVWNTSAEVLV